MKLIKTYLIIWLNACVWFLAYEHIQKIPFLLTVGLFTSIGSIIYLLFIFKKLEI